VAPGVLVGRGVRLGVGRAVGWVAGVPCGVGVGPWAISGGAADAPGVSAGDELGVGSADGLDAGGPLLPGDAVGDAAGDGEADGPSAVTGVGVAAPTPSGGAAGATKPAVMATVARMRFRTPIATTRRARCAVVTVYPEGSLFVERVRSADGRMVAPTPRPRLSRPTPPG